MCVTRVAKVLAVDGDKANVKFVDGGAVREVDVSMVNAKKGSYVEVFADQALSSLTAAEAKWRKELWSDMKGRLEETRPLRPTERRARPHADILA